MKQQTVYIVRHAETTMNGKYCGSKNPSLSKLGKKQAYMLQKKLELMMDMNNKKIINELSKLTTVISSINENIFQIRGLLNGKAVVSETPANESRVVHKIEPAAYEKNQSEINKVKNDDKPMLAVVSHPK